MAAPGNPLTPERWRRIEELFAEVGELPRANWDDALRQKCGDDLELAREVKELLEQRHTRTGFIEPPHVSSSALALEGPDLSGKSLGEFDLIERIGKGAMGVVYRARQRSLDREVALKVLQPSFASDARRIERFEREALSIARLNHPGIVPIYRIGNEDGTRFFAMELVRGPDVAREIARLIERRPGEPFGLPPFDADDYLRAVARLVQGAADALAHAHEHGIVHRDVKPANMLLDPRGVVRLVDFGLARNESLGTLTRDGEGAGTPQYMSPEQIRGRRAAIDARTDVYSLGVVLYELLTLRRPYHGATTDEELYGAILHGHPPRLQALNRRVPRDLAIVCATAMALERADRYPSAAEFRDDLGRFLRGEAIHARPLPLALRAVRWANRRRALLAGVAAGLIVAAGVGAWFADKSRDPQRERLTSALEDPRLDERSIANLVGLRRDVLEISNCWMLRAKDGTDADALESRLTEIKRNWMVAADAAFERAKDLRLTDGEREGERLRALLGLTRAAALFPEDQELASRASAGSALPTLAVRSIDSGGREIPATVFLRKVDVATSTVGARQHLGRTPLASQPITAGYYRVVVMFDAGGFRELICSLGTNASAASLTAQRRDDEERVDEGMIRFEATRYRFALTPEMDAADVALEAFEMDATEVSNSDWRKFLDQHPGHEAPRYWKSLPIETLADLPVVGVDWEEMTEYAAWRGKRLPSAIEWQYAARGAEGRLYPQGALAPGERPRGNVLVEEPMSGRSEEEDATIYARCARPVRSDPDARTPEGLFHMLGNVEEFTESMAITLTGSTFNPRPWDRWLYGGAWNAFKAGTTLEAIAYDGIGPNTRPHFRGFRCARSAQP